MLGTFDYRDGYGNCPQGYYRPAPMYDCRPNVSGARIQQQGLQSIAAHYIDDPIPVQAGATTQGATTGAIPGGYQVQASLPAPIATGGISPMMLIIGAAALVFVMKKK